MNNMEIQYPVGQGGLHLGIIGDSAYIYDCGCFGGSKIYEKYIDEIANLLEKASELDTELYIFISHLHLDHCNGLPYLLKKIKNSKKLKPKIYIPAISPQDEIHLLLTSTIEEEAEYNSYYNLVVYHRIEYISPDSIIELSEENLEAGTKRIEEGSMSFFDWILYPFIKKSNSDESIIDRDFIDSYKKEYSVNLGDLGVIIKYLKDYKNLKELKNFYEKYTESKKNKFHDTMLCLYSGAHRIRLRKRYRLFGRFDLSSYRFNYWNFPYFTGWLHTGDIELKGEDTINKFKKHYKDYLPNVMVMQIPHHGSSGNIDRNFRGILNHNLDVLYYLTCQANPDPKNHKCPEHPISFTPQVYESTEQIFSIMGVEF